MTDDPARADQADEPTPETLERVARRVAEVLALEPKQVQPGAQLMTDLGADSLDLVELMYLLEQEFDITLGQQDLSLSAQLGLPEERLHRSEVLTEEALGLLRQRFPAAQQVLVPGAKRKELAALVTVREVARAVTRRLRD